MKPCISDNSYLESYNQPRQVFPKTYLPNGYVDIVRPSVLLSTGLLHGNKILLNLTQRTADIDNIDDYEIAKQLLNNEKYLDLKKALDRQL